jgi:hypothetical protein
MTIRRTVCAVALPLLPVVLMISTLVSPTDSTSNGPQLAAAAAHGGRWVAASSFELLGAVLIALATVGVAGAVRGRGLGLANAGGVVGVLGAIGMTFISLHHWFIYALATTDTAVALHVLHRLDSSAGPVAFPMMFCGPISLVLCAGAAVRAGIAARWTIAGALVFFVVDMLPIPGAEEIQGIVGVATFTAIAVRLLRPHAEAATHTRAAFAA